jgi:hypothetical protein
MNAVVGPSARLVAVDHLIRRLPDLACRTLVRALYRCAA